MVVDSCIRKIKGLSDTINLSRNLGSDFREFLIYAILSITNRELYTFEEYNDIDETIKHHGEC